MHCSHVMTIIYHNKIVIIFLKIICLVLKNREKTKKKKKYFVYTASKIKYYRAVNTLLKQHSIKNIKIRFIVQMFTCYYICLHIHIFIDMHAYYKIYFFNSDQLSKYIWLKVKSRKINFLEKKIKSN